jgi:non-ribosomal peptide synthetase-like protein
MGIMSRLLNFLIKEDKVYVLYGIHHVILGFITGASNSKAYNILFGDSSYIIPFLRLIGYNLCNYVQTGSNFGTQQKHDVPTMCEIGRGTMVSSGVTMLNAKFTSNSFRVAKVRMAEDNYLGNDIHYLAGVKVGRNCLLGTRVMLPLHGEVRENVGLLGSPCFEIPRMSLRDKQLSEIDDATRREQLRKKNFANLWSMASFVLYFWAAGFAVIMLAHALFLMHGIYGDVVLYPAAYGVFIAGIAYLIFGEWLSFGFKRLRPTVCSMYDPYFWHVERYWKYSENVLIQLFKGTPFRSILWRAAGARVGKKLFDDGCGMTEKTLVTIGDYCTLNDASELQSHSLEEGVFKADHIVLGNGCTVGVQGFVHYGTIVGDNALIDTDTFLMKGEVVEVGAFWQGNPARPV